MRQKLNFIKKTIILFFGMTIFSCSQQDTEKHKTITLKPKKEVWNAGPNFNVDSAYSFIETQVLFGPRIPNTAKHTACGDWLVKKLNSYQLKTSEQIGEVTAFNMSKLPLRNISKKIYRLLSSTFWSKA